MSSTHSRRSWRISSPNSPFHTGILVCLVALLSYLAAELGGGLVIRPQMLWPVWPGCALLVAVLLLAPGRIWPILIAAGLTGFVLYDLQAGLTLRTTALLILADTVEVLIAALGVSYSFSDQPRLNSVKSLATYSFFAVMLAPLAAAFIATAAFGGNYWIRWRIGFFTEALALLTLTPAILTGMSTRRVWAQKSLAFHFEAATLIAGLTFVCYIAFVAPLRGNPPVPLYSLLPFLLWAALRFGITGISTSMILVAFLAIWGTVHGRGPFAGSEPLTDVMSLQLFLFFAAAPFMVLAVLVEEQKQTERAFRESEKRFRSLADTAPALIWMSGTDKLCTYFNKPWLEFTGRSIDRELGNGWAEGVHIEDLQRCMETYTQAFDRRDDFRTEYRLRRHDGEYRWILDIGVPRFDQDRCFIGYIGIGVDVSERKLAEEKLREYEKAVEGSEDMLAVVDREYRYVIANRKFLNYRNMTKDQVVGHLVSEVLNKGIFESVVKGQLDECFQGKVVRYEMKYTYPEIGERDIFISNFPIEGATGVDRVACILQDVTERKRTEEALRKSEERFRLATQAGKMYAYEWDVATDRVERSEAYANILGLSGVPRSETHHQFSSRVHADDRAQFDAAVAGLTPENPTTKICYRVLRSDGTVVWVEKNGRAFFDEQGRMLRTVGIVVDITERKTAEEALSQTEERFRLAARAGKMAAYEWDAATERLAFSGEVDEILGEDAGANATLEHILTIVPAEDRERAVAAGTQLTPEKPSLQIRHRIVRPDGTLICVERSSRAYFDEHGKMLRVVGMLVDITDRVRAEEDLRQKDRELSEAQRIAGVGSWHWDIQNDIAIWSEELYRIAGRDPVLPAPNNKESPGLLSTESWARLQRAAEATVRDGRSYELDLEMIRPDGTTRWVTARAEAVRDTTGRIVQLRGTTQDITERKLSQDALASLSRRLIEAQEQERTRIARELHDDMGQRLALLANELEQLQHDPLTLSEVRSRIGELQKQTTHLATDIQTLSHELHSAKLEYLGIAAAMRGFCQEFGEQTKVQIDFKNHDLPNPLSAEISLGLFRVLQEALHNSVKHSRVRHVEVRLWGTLDEIHLAVSDSGAGFDSEVAKQSRGLGLISMEERLRLLKGTLSIESQPKRGTTIHARVPIGSGSDSLRAAV